jgi:hypothetical protein
MQKIFVTIGLVLFVLLSSFAQNVDPVSAPADVLLKLETQAEQRQFHLGEFIPVTFSYSATTPRRYVWVTQSSKLAAGRSLEISCSPAAENVGGSARSGDDMTFARILNAPCGGAGGGYSSGCADCDGEYPLTAKPLMFGIFSLNAYVRFCSPGTYTCQASSAEVTATSRDEKIRPALLVKSNTIVLNIVNDPGWAHSSALAYASAYEKLCRGDGVAEHHFLECTDVARRITYLDTAESLAVEVEWFDGRQHGWDNGFWDAIQHSSNREEALRLMSARIQQPDFEVSTDVVIWLASSALRMEAPDAFMSGTPATYHSQAVEKLLMYVRLLGGSLKQKNSTVLDQSVKTYSNFADQKYCEMQPLIPTEEQNNVLTGLDARP